MAGDQVQEMPPHWFATAIHDAVASLDVDAILGAAHDALRQNPHVRLAITEALKDKPGIIGPGIEQRVRLAIGKQISEYPK